jgi:hypothetical protein
LQTSPAYYEHTALPRVLRAAGTEVHGNSMNSEFSEIRRRSVLSKHALNSLVPEKKRTGTDSGSTPFYRPDRTAPTPNLTICSDGDKGKDPVWCKNSNCLGLLDFGPRKCAPI